MSGIYIRIEREGRWHNEDVVDAPVDDVVRWLTTLNDEALEATAVALSSFVRRDLAIIAWALLVARDRQRW